MQSAQTRFDQLHALLLRLFELTRADQRFNEILVVVNSRRRGARSA